MTNKTALSFTLLSLSACGLLNVNGKPIGGGSTPTTSSSAEAEEPKTDDKGFESGADYEARRQRTYEAQEKKAAAEKAGQPEICSAYGISNSIDIKLDKFSKIDDPTHDWKLDAEDFAEAMCSTRGKNLELRPKVMALRDKWMKLHGLDEDDFIVVYAQSKGRGWPNQSYRDIPGPIGHMTWPDYKDVDAMGARISALGRVSYVERCLQLVHDKGLLQNILCTTEPLDATKALAEIEASKDVNVQTRYHLRQTVRDTVSAQKVARAELAKLAKDDPGVAALIAIAEAQQKEWTAPSAARAKLIALIETMEAATKAKKTSAFAGCEATTRAAWSEIVKSAELPTVTQSEVQNAMVAAVFKTPEAYLAYRALEQCAAGVDASFTPRFDILGVGGTRRGPRTATIAAWMAAAGDIKFDSKELSMSSLFRDLGTRDGTISGRTIAGTIEKVAPKGAFVEVTFKQDLYEMEDCIASRPTGRISRIESNGAVSYEHVCTKMGMVKYDRTPEPVTLSGLVAQGLKPGMLFMVSEYGFPIAATAGIKAKKAVWVFGVTR